MDWVIPKPELEAMKDHCLKGFPLESCGLLIGPIDDTGKPVGEIFKTWPAKNASQSARVYEVDSSDFFEATKYAQSLDLDIVGVYHSHTHSMAYPSKTDIEKAVDPNWCYIIVSLANQDLDVKFFSIDEANVDELQSQVA